MGGPEPTKTTPRQNQLPAARQHSHPQPREQGLVAEMTFMFQELSDKFDEHCHAINSTLSSCLEKNHADLVAEVRKFHAETLETQPQQQQQSAWHRKFRQEQHQQQNPEKHVGLQLAAAEADTAEAPSVVENAPANKLEKQYCESQRSLSFTNMFSQTNWRENEWISHWIGRVNYVAESRLRSAKFRRSRYAEVASTAWFNTFWYSLIVVCAALNGYHTNIGMSAVMSQQAEPRWINIAELTFSCLFLVELSIRIGLLRGEYFRGRDSCWNIFDALLIMSTVVADIFDIHDAMRLLRGIRIVRLFRAIKGSSNLLQLRLLITCMVRGMSSLLWATVVVLLMMYSFAILFMQAAEVYLRDENDIPIQTLKALQQYYRTLPTTMLSLFMAVTGGVDWGDIREPIAAIHWLWGFCFTLYVFFVVFGFFNVLIGLFVESAFDSSKMDKDLVLQAETERTETFMMEVKQMFNEMDSEASGQVTREQFVASQSDPRMMSYMQMHQLTMIEPNFFFQMLDRDGSGSVSLEELVVGMMRLGGQARSSDVLTLIMLIRGLREEMKCFSKDTSERLAPLVNLTGISIV